MSNSKAPKNKSKSIYGIEQIAWRFSRNKIAVFFLILLIILVVASLFAPYISDILDIRANDVDLTNRFASPSFENLLGTDELGRDIFVRLLFGGRVSLSVGIVTAIFAAAIGGVVGLIAGFFGGKIDTILMRLTDGIIILPLLPFLIILSAIDWQKIGVNFNSDGFNLWQIVLIIAIFGWTTTARLVRAQVYVIKEQDYIRAAKAMGVSSPTIIFKHILPNVIAVIIVATTLSIGNIILLESVLSFLGLGIQPPTASWGNMLTNAQNMIWEQPLITLYPGFLIFITVMAFNVIGDALQDALNPKSVY